MKNPHRQQWLECIVSSKQSIYHHQISGTHEPSMGVQAAIEGANKSRTQPDSPCAINSKFAPLSCPTEHGQHIRLECYSIAFQLDQIPFLRPKKNGTQSQANHLVAVLWKQPSASNVTLMLIQHKTIHIRRQKWKCPSVQSRGSKCHSKVLPKVLIVVASSHAHGMAKSRP